MTLVETQGFSHYEGHHCGHLLKILLLVKFLCEKDTFARGLRAREDMLSVQIYCVLDTWGKGDSLMNNKTYLRHQ